MDLEDFFSPPTSSPSVGMILGFLIAAKEIDSTVPWIGVPVGYAVSGVLLTVFGYFAMFL